MTRKTTSVSVESEVLDWFKRNNINFSAFVREASMYKMNGGEDYDPIEHELQTALDEQQRYKEKIEEAEDKIEKLKKKQEQREQKNEKVNNMNGLVVKTAHEYEQFSPSEMRRAQSFIDTADELEISKFELAERVQEVWKTQDE